MAPPPQQAARRPRSATLDVFPIAFPPPPPLPFSAPPSPVHTPQTIFSLLLEGVAPPAADPYEAAALSVAKRAWATSTWAARIGLQRRLREFVEKHGTRGADLDICRFCEAQQVSETTRHQYAKTLATVAQRLLQ